ncbi:MAG TPA: phospholipid carrier-dependent glycosyltransferase, partial [Chloroflexi bacterium]|nr:phospholipid carrier-dependent glycosyltransferase [Chloroflexota bacterium]
MVTKSNSSVLSASSALTERSDSTQFAAEVMTLASTPWRKVILLLVLIIALGLRLYDVNWDEYQHAHPDERWITMVATTIHLPQDWRDALNPRKSTFNPLYDPYAGHPRNFAYGHLPLYLLTILAGVLSALASVVKHLSPALASLLHQLPDYDHINLLGRVLSAFIDTGTVYLVYLLGKRIYGFATGLLAAAFVAFTVSHIQLAHFYAFDPVATFFVVLAVYFSACLAQEGSVRYALLAGAAAGMAVSSKFSAMPVLAAVAAACLAASCPPLEKEQEDAPRFPQLNGLSLAARLLILAGLAAFVAFAITSPFAILDFKAYIAQIVEQGKMVRGEIDLPYTRQYRGTTPFVYHIEQELRWGMGWTLGITAFAGFAWTLWRGLRRRLSPAEWVILAWVIPYFALTGSFMVKFMRYMLPVLPFLSLMGAHLLLSLSVKLFSPAHKATDTADLVSAEHQPTSSAPDPDTADLVSAEHQSISSAPDLVSGARKKRTSPWPLILITLVLLPTVLWTLAFVNGVYGGIHPWVAASRWIYANVPEGSVIAVEHWDDELPKPLREPGMNSAAHGYRHVTLPLYEEDTEQKFNVIKDALRQADYIVIASNRLYRSIPRLPPRYPMTIRYYELLFSGKLGFEKVAEFTSYPRLGPWVIPDNDADESFTVYDHPKPMVFKKVRELSDEEWWQLLGGTWEGAIPGYVGGPVEEEQRRRHPSLLLDTPVDRLPVIDDFRWNGLANANPIAAIVIWWLAVEVIGLAAWPLAHLAFRRLHLRGYVLSKSLGLLLIAYVNWLLASLRLGRNTALTVFL